MSGRVRTAIIAAACSWACLGGPRKAFAQVDPRGPVRTIATSHFRVHFRADSGPVSEALGQRAAAVAEWAYAKLARELTPPAGPIDLLLADNVDYSNGFAQVFPTNRVVVYAVPPISAPELRFHDDWLQLVITHELAHIFHLDRARGIWALGRHVLGRNPLLFPNSNTPSWVKEGLAQYYESKLTGSGRMFAAEAQLPARAAALAKALPPISRWSLATSRFPRGTTSYAYGALTMARSATIGGDSSMRRFVDATASFPIPFLLNRGSSLAFGASFSRVSEAIAADLGRMAETTDLSGDAKWQVVSDEGWYAASPRWMSVDSVLWSASNGREVAGLYVADVRRPGHTRRIARRNALDANVPLGGDSVLFAQLDSRDPYTVRSDLYVGHGAAERRLTNGARLTQPDVRRDGAIVAVQLGAATTRLVRVDRNGAVSSLTLAGGQSNWAEPRWAPDGARVAAVELLPSGEQRIVVLDTTGVRQQIVSGARAVFAGPAFTPDGTRLVWSSDRSGRMQLETARVVSLTGMVDTLQWRDEREAVRVASNVTTGVYEPSVSPDGTLVLALIYRVDGLRLAIAPLDTTGPVARNTHYRARNPSLDSIAVSPIVTPSTRYGAGRQLLPRYWLPVISEGRLGYSTYGIASSSRDILGRHAWAANAQVNPQFGEWDGSAAYRYAGLGVPVADFTVSQDWDATFQIVDTKNNPLGSIARRRRFATVSSTFSRPRVRHTVAATVGAQYELRDFTATVDSLLGPTGALLRRGTRYPQLFVNTSLSTVRRGVLALSYEEGVTLTTNTSYRWRQDAPSLGSWRSVVAARGYVPVNLPGFSRHVFSLRGAVGVSDTNTATEFGVGGVSGVAAELLPGVNVGDPTRTFPVRGVVANAQRGIRAIGGSAEYRLPLVMLRGAPSPFTFFADRLSMTVFSDAGRAWCPSAFAAQSASIGLCERPGARDGWIASAGAELVLDAALQYDIPYRFRIGAAAPYVAPAGISRRGAFYLSLGSFF